MVHFLDVILTPEGAELVIRIGRPELTRRLHRARDQQGGGQRGGAGGKWGSRGGQRLRGGSRGGGQRSTWFKSDRNHDC